MGFRLNIAILVIIFSATAIMPVQAAAKFGKIYDIDGEARLKPAVGKGGKITRDKDLLRVVTDGDTIEVIGKGRVVIAAYADRKSYVIESDSVVSVSQNEIKAIKGKVSIRQKSVHVAEGEALSNPMLGIVLRGVQPCVKTIAPVNTVVLTLTPELIWQNACAGSQKVTLEVLRDDDDERVFSVVTEGGNFKIPEGALSYGVTYRWVVKGKGDYNASLATIRVPKEDETRAIAQNIADYRSNMRELPDRLSYVSYLMEKGLNQDAQSEIGKLTKEFPENGYIEELAKKVK